MRTIAITGANGRLGGALLRHRQQLGDRVIPLTRSVLDLGVPEQIAAALEPLPFDVLIHSAALTSLEQCEADPQLAYIVNAQASGVLAEVCARRKAPMIHVSTDYVFGGEQPGLRTESDQACPINVYGHSKLAGEEMVCAAYPEAWVARVSWLFGPDKPSFVETILDRASCGDSVSAIADKWSTPSYTRDVVESFDVLLEQGNAGGVIHVCNRGEATWHGYAEEILRLAGQSQIRVGSLALSEMASFVARRPVHTAMNPALVERLMGRPMRSWQDALADYMQHEQAMTLS